MKDESHVIAPLEFHWSFACPLIGPSIQQQVFCLHRAMMETGIRGAFITGLHCDDDLWKLLQFAFLGKFVPLEMHTDRCVAWIVGGCEGFLSRRSAHFRARMRQAVRRAIACNLRTEYLPDLKEHEIPALCERLLAVEAKSWKGKSGTGIGEWMNFHENLIRELVAVDRLRCLFLTLDGQDVAYLVAGISGEWLRGWQMSFDDAHSDLSLGNLAQMEIIERGAQEGLRLYDLGSSMPYKERWCDRHDPSECVLVSTF